MHSQIFLLACLLIATCFGNPVRERSPPIVGGTPANITEFPYFVDLGCGGSIISREWAVTAAHCVTDPNPSSVSLRFGSSLFGEGGILRTALKIVRHEGYGNHHNDIALIKFNPIEFSDSIQPVSLPLQDQSIAPGKMGTIIGHGDTDEDGDSSIILLKASVPFVKMNECKKKYQSTGISPVENLEICFGFKEGGVDACKGDSGGPLVVDGVLTGITSWGIGCARPNLPGVYANVAHYRDWIKQHSGV